MAAGMNPMDLRRGMTAAVEHVVNLLDERKKDISSTDEITQVRQQLPSGAIEGVTLLTTLMPPMPPGCYHLCQRREVGW